MLLIDIGADLGRLGEILLENNQVDYVWNVELSRAALERSKKIYQSKGLINRAEFIYSDGFQNLEPERAGKNSLVIVLAGFGANTTLSILQAMSKEWLSKKLCLISLSHTNPIRILEWLEANGWTLIKEEYLKYRKKIYPILLFSNYLKRSCSNLDVPELFLEYWGSHIDNYSKLDSMSSSSAIQRILHTYNQLRRKNIS
ncbi:tRNA (adenine(22)-N(1))-methyltransferase TrmK [Candidatus Mycoplasma haematominutum]|uniref:SAM-dependent methyltransferase n=1 Tax=Candidatus Mycoplasma haematominutum 'Birmingham 1' TaxID=1116213 RepID=G8C302_9MOLU|nr:tRNA (adenine(22)-N(1))-methyltransferase TrmK [Candidatus Mycoplasma haematominutum]CCE66700.1 conserved hypothetical protein (SAM-dependentmethyltransferase family protein) [Candidatus Mycoplasma haematominutum 'Birmingham 1']